MPIKLGKYTNFKGNEYEVIENATHSETLEEMVVFRSLYEGNFWVCCDYEYRLLHMNYEV